MKAEYQWQVLTRTHLHNLSDTLALLLGQYYSLLEELWNECLWNEWYLHSHKEVDFIISFAEEKAHQRAVGRYRNDSLSFQSINVFRQSWIHLSEAQQRKLSRSWEVRIEGKGRQQKYRIKHRPFDLEKPTITLIIRFQKQEEYFDSLLDLPLPNLGNITLANLLDAWSLIHSLGEEILNTLPQIDDVDSVDGSGAGTNARA